MRRSEDGRFFFLLFPVMARFFLGTRSRASIHRRGAAMDREASPPLNSARFQIYYGSGLGVIPGGIAPPFHLNNLFQRRLLVIYGAPLRNSAPSPINLRARLYLLFGLHSSIMTPMYLPIFDDGEGIVAFIPIDRGKVRCRVFTHAKGHRKIASAKFRRSRPVIPISVSPPLPGKTRSTVASGTTV